MDKSSSSSSSSQPSSLLSLDPIIPIESSSSSQPFVFYRLSSVGKALLTTLDTMVQEGILDGRAAAEILENYDVTFAKILQEELYNCDNNNNEKRRKDTAEVKGDIESLQHLVDSKQQIGDVTSIDARNVTFDLGHKIITVDRARFFLHKNVDK